MKILDVLLKVGSNKLNIEWKRDFDRIKLHKESQLLEQANGDHEVVVSFMTLVLI